MRIAGITPTSTLDYPDRLCLTVFTQGCNRECSYCHNKDMIPDEPKSPLMPWDRVLSIISGRRYYVDAVVFSGGEPCLQGDLMECIQDISDLGLLVGLHTNGDLLTRAIAQQCDYILLSHPTKKKLAIADLCGHVVTSRVVNINGKFENQITEVNI